MYVFFLNPLPGFCLIFNIVIVCINLILKNNVIIKTYYKIDKIENEFSQLRQIQ